jgi:hypothetical protein
LGDVSRGQQCRRLISQGIGNSRRAAEVGIEEAEAEIVGIFAEVAADLVPAGEVPEPDVQKEAARHRAPLLLSI